MWKSGPGWQGSLTCLGPKRRGGQWPGWVHAANSRGPGPPLPNLTTLAVQCHATRFSLNIFLPPPRSLRNPTIVFFFYFIFLSLFSFFFFFFAKLILSLSCHKITSENTTSLQKVTNDTDSQENTFLWSLETPVTGTQVSHTWEGGQGEITSRDRGEIPALIWGRSQLALGRSQGLHKGQGREGPRSATT